MEEIRKLKEKINTEWDGIIQKKNQEYLDVKEKIKHLRDKCKSDSCSIKDALKYNQEIKVEKEDLVKIKKEVEVLKAGKKDAMEEVRYMKNNQYLNNEIKKIIYDKNIKPEDVEYYL